MSLLSEIRSQQLAARKARKDGIAINLLTVLLGEVERIGKDKQRETTDEEAILAIRRMLKSNSETILILEDFPRETRSTELMKAKDEKIILESFLPTQLDEAQTLTAVMAAISTVDAISLKDIGKIMGWLKAEHGTSINMKLASDTVKEILKA